MIDALDAQPIKVSDATKALLARAKASLVKGLRIWATRPPHQNTQWQETLARNSYLSIDCPLLEIQEVVEPQARQCIKNRILELDHYSKLIFVSQNAVRYGCEWIDQYWPQLPLGLEFYAIGKASSAKLNQFLQVHGVGVIDNGSMMTSDALLALDGLRYVEGHKILIFRGEGGLPTLGETLCERQATVKYCELYQRLACKAGREAIHRIKKDDCYLDLYPIFSGEALKTFVDFCQQENLSYQNLPLIVPSTRVQHMAQTYQFSHIIKATNASEDSMLSAINSLKELLE